MTAVPTISGYCGGRHRLLQHLRREARDPGTRRRAATRRRFRGRFGAGQSRGRAVATRSATTSAHGRPRRIRAHLKVNYGAWGAPGASWTGTGSVPSPAGLCLNGNLPPSIMLLTFKLMTGAASLRIAGAGIAFERAGSLGIAQYRSRSLEIARRSPGIAQIARDRSRSLEIAQDRSGSLRDRSGSRRIAAGIPVAPALSEASNKK